MRSLLLLIIFLCAGGGLKAQTQMAETKAKYEGENIDFADYSSAENEGEFKGKLVGRFWGRKGNLVLFFDMENTSKIVASAWKESDYLGFKDFMLKFVRSSKSDRVYLREAKQM